MAFKDLFVKRSNKITAVPDVKQYFLNKSTGKDFNLSRAELNSTVFTCINIITNTISKCDLEIYRTTDGRKEKVTNHYWYDAVRFNPDLKLSTKKWLGYALTSMYLDGNAFFYVDVATQQFKALGELEKISPVVDNDTYYKFKNIDTWLPSSQLLHFYLISKDGGRYGLNPIESIKAELEIQKGGEAGVMNYYRNGLNNQLYLEVDIESGEKFTDKNKAKEFINKSLELHGGIFNNHTIPQIPPLYRLKSLPQAQLDFLSNNKYSISQIGALFNVPEAFLGTQSSQTYGKADQQVAFFNTCLSNVCSIVTDELSNKLLTIKERKAGLSIGFDFTNLYDTDYDSKATYLGKLNGMGAISANEIRQQFNLSWVEGVGMNTYYRQAQYVDINSTLINPISSPTSTGSTAQ